MYGAQLIAACATVTRRWSFSGWAGTACGPRVVTPWWTPKTWRWSESPKSSGNLPKIWGLFRKLIAEADKRRPDLAVVIDSPAFNWRVARQMRKRGVPVVYYVCPQFWAWRQGRVRLLRKYVHKALVIFPFEEQFYRERGVDATFVGHPLADLRRPAIEREDYAHEHDLDPAKQWITLMPGSRVKEVRMNLPAILRIGCETRRGLRISVAGGADAGPQFFRRARRIGRHPPGSRVAARALPFAGGNHRQRNGHRGSGDDGHAVCHGLPRLAAHLPAGQAAGEGSAVCHGEPDCGGRGRSRAGAAGFHRRKSRGPDQSRFCRTDLLAKRC